MKPEIILATATIIGALAIALANVWNNYKINKTNLRITQKAHEEKKKQAKREKLEQLMRAVYALRAWTTKLQLTFSSIPSQEALSGEVKKMGESPIAEIDVLTALYFNDELEMKKSVNDLSLHNHKYLKKILEIYELQSSDPKKITKEQSFDKHQDELIRLIDVVRNECQTVMAKLDKW